MAAREAEGLMFLPTNCWEANSEKPTHQRKTARGWKAHQSRQQLWEQGTWEGLTLVALNQGLTGTQLFPRLRRERENGQGLQVLDIGWRRDSETIGLWVPYFWTFLLTMKGGRLSSDLAGELGHIRQQTVLMPKVLERALEWKDHPTVLHLDTKRHSEVKGAPTLPTRGIHKRAFTSTNKRQEKSIETCVKI